MTIYIIDLEPVESRYTAQWKKFIPEELSRLTNDKVITVSGGTPGSIWPDSSTTKKSVPESMQGEPIDK